METGVQDPKGLETLELFAGKYNFNKWLFDALHPYILDNVLEIGSGIGNISAFLLSNYFKVSLSDLRPEYIEALMKRFSGRNELKQVLLLDLSVKEMESRYPELIESFDAIIASNVLEHIEDDQRAIKNCYKMLKKGGRLIILVPAHQALYNSLDEELGHCRRYSRKGLATIFVASGFTVTHSCYFNMAGIFGWWLNGNLLGKRLLPKNQLNAFNRMIPIIKTFDKITFHRFGLSVIIVGEK